MTLPHDDQAHQSQRDFDGGLPRIPVESLAALLSYRLSNLAAHLVGKHTEVPSVPAAALRFFRRRARALTAHRDFSVDSPRDEEEPASATDLARFPAATLDGTRRELLSRKLGMALPVVRIHHHHHAQQIVKRMQADALSIGRDVLMRSPQALQGPRGTALLGHELTHAAQEQARPRSRRATAAEERNREITAITNERLLLAPTAPASASVSPISTPTADAIPSGSGAQPIRAAARSREVSGTSGAAIGAPSAGLDAMQIRQIRDGVYRDLMTQIREEFERGS